MDPLPVKSAPSSTQSSGVGSTTTTSLGGAHPSTTSRESRGEGQRGRNGGIAGGGRAARGDDDQLFTHRNNALSVPESLPGQPRPKREGTITNPIATSAKILSTLHKTANAKKYMAIPLDKPVDFCDSKGLHPAHRLQLMMSVAALRAHQHTGVLTSNCNFHWHEKTATFFTRLCNNPRFAKEECDRLTSSNVDCMHLSMSQTPEIYSNVRDMYEAVLKGVKGLQLRHTMRSSNCLENGTCMTSGTLSAKKLRSPNTIPANI
mmetsp:Transcript_10624/g.23036  ORF Transcript_10624/g.23036 Transcript_10624/m.23036 type:complete len:262 (+) Transcript_10624:331-1116(+)